MKQSWQLVLVCLLLLLCGLTDAQQCNLMPPSNRAARMNPGLYLSNSTVDARVCCYECSRIRPPPSHAYVKDKYCLCGPQDTGVTASANCPLNCPLTSGSKCGSSSNEPYYSSFNVTVPVSGVRLVSEPNPQTGEVNSTIYWTYGELTCDCLLTFSFSESTRLSGACGNGTSLQNYLHNTGMTGIRAQLTDSENNTEWVSNRANIVHPLLLLDVTVDAYQAYNRRFNVYLTIRKGSNASMSVNFGNGHSMSVIYVPPTEAVRSGPRMQASGSHTAPAANHIYFMPGNVFKHNATLVGYEVIAGITSTFTLQIWRPTCPQGHRYCFQSNACLQLGRACSSSASGVATGRRKSCSTGYSLSSLACSNSTGEPDTPPSVFDATHYTFVAEIVIAPGSCLMSQLAQSQWLSVLPGDIPAINPQSSGIRRDSAARSNEGFVEYAVDSTTITNYANRATPGTNITIAAPTVQQTATHRLNLYSFKTVTVLAPYVYENHSCPSTPPMCREPIRFNLTVSAFNRWNTSASAAAFVDTREIEVQVPVTNVTISTEPIHPTNWLRNFSVLPHAASRPTYCWNFADGSSPKCTDQLQVQHRFHLPGIYNVTATCSNNVSVAVAWSVVTVQNTIEGLTGSFKDGPGTLYGLPLPLVLTHAQGTNASLQVDWNDGQGFESYEASDDGVNSSPQLTTMYFDGRTGVAIDTGIATPVSSISASSQTDCLTKSLQSQALIRLVHFQSPSTCRMFDKDILYSVGLVVQGDAATDSIFYLKNGSCSNNMLTDTAYLANLSTAAGSQLSPIDLESTGWLSTGVADYVQVFFMSRIDLFAIGLRGHASSARWTSLLGIKYSNFGDSWEETNVTGNTDQNTQIFIPLSPVLTGRYFRFYGFVADAAFRMTLKGCFAQRIETRVSKLPNATVSQQVRTIRVNATNLVSSAQLQIQWPVELPITGLKLHSARPLPFGNDASLQFTAQSGSAFKIDAYYNGRRVVDSLVQVGNNGPPVSGQVHLNLTYLTSVGVFPFNMTADNYVTLARLLVSSSVEVQYPVDGFRVTGFNHSMLKRPQNVTDSIKFHICIDRTVRNERPPTRVSYSIDFGDGSPIRGPISVTCVEGNQPPGQVFCPSIGANQTFCQETIAHVYPVPGIFNVTLNLSNDVSRDYQFTTHTVYSQVTNVQGVFQLHPEFSGDSLKQVASRDSYYPMEMPVLMLAQMDFGIKPNVWYDWSFGDGSNLQTTFNVPLMNYTYRKPGTYNVTVTAYNPQSRLTASKLIYIFQSVSGVRLSSDLPYPMLTEYRVLVSAVTMGTEACYLIDFTAWSEAHMSRVRQTKEALTVFGNQAYCAATTPYKNYMAEYWNSDAATAYTNAYANYIAGTGRAQLEVTILKNITLYGARTITVTASNKVSTFSSNWLMTSARGYCNSPKARLDQNIQKTFRRGEDVIISAKQDINCYNSSTQFRWSVEVLNGGTWSSYQTELTNFYENFKEAVNRQPYSYYTQGIYYPELSLGMHLIQLRLPKYALKHFSTTGTKYRITLELVMVEEPSLGSNNSLEITLQPTDLSPNIRASVHHENVWFDVASPAQFQYKSLLNLSCADSLDPDVFIAGGETQDLQCDWYCYRSCEDTLVLTGENLTYERGGQSGGERCDQFILDGIKVTELGCFARNTLRYRNYMPSVSLNDWKVTRKIVSNQTTLETLNPVVSFVYNGTQFKEPWLQEIETKNVTNYLYAMNGTKNVLVETANMFELQEHFMVLVVRDRKGIKKPRRTLFQMKLTRGMPPRVAFSCVSNCNKARMRGLLSGVNPCNKEVIKIDGTTAFKLQALIVDYNPAATYSFEWQLSSISNPFEKCPDDLTERELVDSFQWQKVQSGGEPWSKIDGVTKSSTGILGPGLALDENLPFLTNVSSSQYFALQISSYRGSDFNNTGFTRILFAINGNPDLSNLFVTVNPPTGEAMTTPFDIDCGGANDEDGILGYYVGYATVPNAQMRQCAWINSKMISRCSISRKSLPSGIKAHGYRVWICVKVYDTIFSFSFASNFSLVVNAPAQAITSDPAFKREKDNILKSGSLTDIVAFASVTATVLNQPRTSISSENGTADTAPPQKSPEELAEAIAVRRSLILGMKNILKSSANDTSVNVDAGEIRNTLDCMKFLTSEPDQIDQESIAAVSDILDNQIQFLMSNSKDGNTGASDIVNAVVPLFETTSNLFSAEEKRQKASGGSSSGGSGSGSGSGSGNSGSGSDSQKKKPNTKLLSTIKNGASAISNKQVVGEKPTILIGGDLGLSVSKAENFKLRDETLTPPRSSECGRVKFGNTKRADGKEDLFSKYNPLSDKFERSAFVSTHFSTVSANTFAAAEGGANLSSNVFMLTTQDGASGTTEPFKITETAPDSEIQILISTRDGNTGTESAFLETLPVKEKMRAQITEVTPDQGLFVKLTRYLNYSMFMENATESNRTVQIPQQILMNNYTYYEGDFEFYVYFRVGRAPTEQAFDYFCKLPLEQPPKCSNPAASTASPDPVGSTHGSNDSAITSATTTASTTTTTATTTSSPITNSCPNRWDTADRWTCFLPPEMLAVPVGKERIYIGVRALRHDLNETGLGLNSSTFRSIPSGVRYRDNVTRFDIGSIDPAFYAVVGYESLVFSTGCRFYNEVSNAMESTGIRLGQCSNPFLTQCFTRHLTSFMSSFYVPPIQFDPADSGWLKLDSNPIAFALVLSLVCFYLIVIVWASKKDREDVTKVGVTPLPDNDPRDEFEYELTFWTGARGGSGTSANVSLILSGDEGDTLPRLIRDPDRLVLQRNGVDSFLMRTPVYLGRLTHMRLWHDNAGSSPNWYFSRLLVHDLQTGDKYYFISNRWFAIDKDDGMVDRIIALSGKEEINGFENVFWTRSQKNLYDGHLWFSVVTRPARSKFTRCQRATACLCLLMSTMMVNLMFYNQSQLVESPKLIEIGPIKFTAHSIYIATVSTLIILPVNVIIVVLFKNRRDRVVVKKGFERGGLMERGAADRRRLAAAGRAQFATDAEAEVDTSQARRDIEHSLDTGRLDADDVSVGMATDRTAVRKSIPLKQLQAAHPDQFGAMPDAVSQSNLRSDTTGKHNKGILALLKSVWSKIFPLPWWSYCIGYALSFATVAVCTYLMVEFANVLGEAKTAEWLASMAVTLLQSIVLVQPIKILAIALVFALLIRKPEEDQDELTKELAMMGVEPMHKTLTMRDLSDPEVLAKLARIKHAAPPPPDARLLEFQRQQRLHELNMQAVIRDIIFYVAFLVFLMLCAYTNQDYRTYLQNSMVQSSVAKGSYVVNNTPAARATAPPKFEDIDQFKTAFEYVKNVLVPTLYPVACYDGTQCSLIRGSNWTQDPSYLLVRQAQLRQVRIPSKQRCKISKYFADIIATCRDEYSLFSEEDGDFGPGWVPYNASVPSHVANPEWQFTSAVKVYGTPYTGQLSTYGGGGYIAALGRTRASALAKMSHLFEHSWLDHKTRAVFIEFLIYNANTNLYSFATFLLEFFNGGGVIRHPKVSTLRLDRYVGANAVFFIALDAIAGIFILIFMVREIRELHKKKCAYFKDFFNVLDFSLIIACIISMALYITRIVVQKLVSWYMKKYPDRFINFAWLVMWDELNQFFLGTVVFIFTVRFLRLLYFNKKIRMLGQVLHLSAGPLGHFGIMFAIVFFAFVQAGYLMFFTVVRSFKTPISTIETLGVMTLNKFDFTSFSVGAGKMGMVFFFIYMLFVSFIMVNFFLTIILISFKHVKDSWSEETNEYEIVDYLSGKFKKLFGIGSARDAQGRIDSRFAYIADELDIEEQDREIQLKVDSMMDRLLLVMTGRPPDKDHLKQQLQRSSEAGGGDGSGRRSFPGGREILSGDN